MQGLCWIFSDDLFKYSRKCAVYIRAAGPESQKLHANNYPITTEQPSRRAFECPVYLNYSVLLNLQVSENPLSSWTFRASEPIIATNSGLRQLYPTGCLYSCQLSDIRNSSSGSQADTSRKSSSTGIKFSRYSGLGFSGFKSILEVSVSKPPEP